MSYYDEVMDYLSDGEWHTPLGISDALGISMPRVHHVLHIAEKYRIVEKGDAILTPNNQRTFQWRRSNDRPQALSVLRFQLARYGP